MLIRKCEQRDLDEVMNIEEQSFDHPYPYRIFEEYLGDELFLVAEDEEVVGYIIGEEDEEHGLIVSIAVSPLRRSEGIGTELMRSVQERMDVDTFFVTVRPSNKSAIRFYKGLNFSKAGMIRDYYENDEDGILLKTGSKGKD